MRAPHPIIPSPRGYLTVTQAAARLGITPSGLYTRIARGNIPAYSYRGKQSPTGWRIYVRARDIKPLLPATSPSPRDPLTVAQAKQEFGITRGQLLYRRKLGLVHFYRLPIARGLRHSSILLDRAELQTLAQKNFGGRRAQAASVLEQMLASPRNHRLTIADVLRHRPDGVKDADIARAFHVSTQRVSQIKQKVFPPHG